VETLCQRSCHTSIQINAQRCEALYRIALVSCSIMQERTSIAQATKDPADHAPASAADPPAATSSPAQPTSATVSRSAATNLLVHSLLVFAVPLLLYVVSSQGYLDFLWARLFGQPTRWLRTVCSAVLAVLGVNAVLVMFVFAAFGETSEASAKKRD